MSINGRIITENNSPFDWSLRYRTSPNVTTRQLALIDAVFNSIKVGQQATDSSMRLRMI